MVRLPDPGKDEGVWGDVLNDYLSVEHNPDGTLKKAADIQAAQTAASNAQTTVAGKADDNTVIHNSLVTAKGDLVTATAASTPAKLGIGSSGQVLTADSSQATGMKWATQTAGGLEIAYAENTAGFTTYSTLTPTNIAGLQIAIPANTPNYILEFWSQVQLSSTAGWTSSDGSPTFKIQLVDEGGICLGLATYRVIVTAASQSFLTTLSIKKRMPATSGAKTITVQAIAGIVNTSFLYVLVTGPGNTTTTAAPGPAYIQAYTR